MEKVGDFACSIGLVSSWPAEVLDQDQMNCSGLLKWAEAYQAAAETLHFEGHSRCNFAFYGGPLMQVVGLSTELTLKVLLRGGGKTEKELRSFSHNTYEAYFAAKEYFDEVKFLDQFFANTDHRKIPNEIRNRLTERGEVDISYRWRVYFDHLRLLDTVYDKPYRNRYAAPGPISLPDAELILVGTKILLSAMHSRLNEEE